MNFFIEDHRAIVQTRRKRFIEIISWVCLVVLLFSTLPIIPIYQSTWPVLAILFCMSLCFGAGIYLNRKGYLTVAANLITFSISLLLFIVSLLEGAAGGDYLYYFPILIAIPFFIDYRKTLQLGFHLLHPTIFLLILTFFRPTALLPGVTSETQALIYTLNATLVIFVCQFFVYEVVVTNLASEKQLRLSEQQLRFQNENLHSVNQGLDQFVYSISHDLRAPVASALGLVELMKDEKDLQEMQEYNLVMERNLRRLDHFIGDILDYSYSNQFEVKKDVIDFEQEIQEAVQQYLYMEGAARVEVAVTVQQDHTFANDRYRLRVILNNIISNAFRYQRPQETNPWIHISCKVSAESALLKIRDNGVGIPSEHIKQIFDMFYRANHAVQGSGLGLYIAKEAAIKMGGDIRVISSEGAFTEFTIELPNRES